MGKKIKITVKDIDKLIFELAEDAQEGDYFCLHDVNDINFDWIKKQIHEKKDEETNKFLASEKVNIINEFKLTDEYQIKDKTITRLESELTSLKEKLVNEYSRGKQETELNFINKISELNQKISELKLENEMKIENEKLKIISEWQEKLHKLENDYKADFDQQKQYFTNKLNQIEREKSINSKTLGNELENTLLQYYNDSLGVNDDCVFTKTTKDIEGTKPDFIFKVIDTNDKSELGSVIVEAKTQLIGSDGHKKNKDYFAKLDLDRKKNNAEFSLLVTELELDDVFVIKKINEYDNMFAVRPSYFISFLSIIRYLFLKRREIKDFEMDFKKRQEIQANFDSMKSEILDNSVRYIDEKLQDILKCAEKISKNAEDIIKSANVVIDRHLDTIKNKIENFKIKKLIKSIEELEQ